MEELENKGAAGTGEEPPPAETENAAGQPAGETAPADAESADAREPVSAEEFLGAGENGPTLPGEDVQLRAVLEALVYVTEEPLSVLQLTAALQQPRERIQKVLDLLIAEYDKPEHGLSIREVAGGYQMGTKPEHHEAVRTFVKNLKPPLKLSLPALETLAVIAYKQPVTAPEIMEVRGVQGAGVLKTLLERKLIAAAGRKNIIGRPILYKTTKEFLVQFGLKDLTELPSLKEFEEIGRMALQEGEPSAEAPAAPAAAEQPPAEQPAGEQPGEDEPAGPRAVDC
jgi:segregation and condensation protein B